MPMQFTGGNDHIFGDEGRDVIAGDVYAVQALAGGSALHGGNDVIAGGDGSDALYGDFGPGPTAAIISGFSTRTGGNDTLLGGNGNDLLMGQLGMDTLNGGAGADTADYSDKSAGRPRFPLAGSTARHGLRERGCGRYRQEHREPHRRLRQRPPHRRRTRQPAHRQRRATTPSTARREPTVSAAAPVRTISSSTPRSARAMSTASSTTSSYNDSMTLGRRGLRQPGVPVPSPPAHSTPTPGAAAAHDANDRIIYDTASGKLYFDADGAGGAAAKLFAIAIDHPTILAGDFFVA